MMKINPEKESEVIIEIAKLACVAARTAPKGNGVDEIVTGIVYGDELKKLTERMREYAQETGLSFFARDASNCEGKIVILVGTRIKNDTLGFEEGKTAEHNMYVSSAVDLGIAIGSLVSKLADFRADNRILYSAGKAAVDLKLLGEDVKIAYGIPISISGKNPFFDRK